MLELIFPSWDAPQNIRAFTTTRKGGISLPPFEGLNVGDHVGDNLEAVLKNRQLIEKKCQLPQAPIYLQQTHSTKVLTLPLNSTSNLNADAVYTQTKNQICTVMTADCLPLLICNRKGSEVAVVHAGWRGLCEGVIENTLKNFQSSPQDLMVWLAPAISQQAFQVGKEVRAAFIEKDPNAHLAFKKDPLKSDKYYADLYHLARLRLERFGLSQIFGGDYCTFSDPEHFYSYRREGQTGRMATMIWFE